MRFAQLRRTVGRRGHGFTFYTVKRMTVNGVPYYQWQAIRQGDGDGFVFEVYLESPRSPFAEAWHLYATEEEAMEAAKKAVDKFVGKEVR